MSIWYRQHLAHAEAEEARYQAALEAEDQEFLRREARCVDPDGYLTHDPDTCGGGPYCRFAYPPFDPYDPDDDAGGKATS